MKNVRKHLVITAVLALLAPCVLAAVPSVARYDVVWERPSQDRTGEMPLGNGDIAAGVYAIENDALYLLLAKSDAFTYSGDIFKTGRVKIELEPNPFASGKPFKQSMDMETGSVRLEADGVTLLVWADANKLVYHVQIDAPHAVSVKANSDLWARLDHCAHNRTSEPIDPAQQDVRLERGNSILWYYAVGDRSIFPMEVKYYNVADMIGTYPDPYRFNTFGNLMESPQLALKDGVLQGQGKSFDIRIHALTKKTPDTAEWIRAIEKQAAAKLRVKKDWKKHCAWWKNFWKRSWIVVNQNDVPEADRGVLDHEGYVKERDAKDPGALVAQGYNVFRYLMACQSRGSVQTKFNGGLFTQPLRYAKKPKYWSTEDGDGGFFNHEDERLWGRRFTFQNQRLLYWPLLRSGDADLMKPFFAYYWDLLPIRRAITQAWFGHEGTYYRENVDPTGSERDCGKGGTDVEDLPLKTKPGENDGCGYYHSYYFTCGLETVTMMIEYAKYSGDTEFQDEVLVPFAREILLFFDKHYERDEKGELRIDPGMVLETWWIAVNPAPDVAGLLHNLDELLAMDVGTTEDKVNWKRFRAEIPEVYIHEIDGRKAIAPAKSWSKKMNSENGLLYPVFPFRRFGIGLGTKDLVQTTMEHRTNPDKFGIKCWTQDQIHWAYAGNAAEAQKGLVHRYSHTSPQCRFPVYGSASPDSCPDFDHFGSGSTALQRMLVQEAGTKILLLPAWPANWDVAFKQHLAGGVVISGKVLNGKLESWNITPKSRKKDVVVCDPQ